MKRENEFICDRCGETIIEDVKNKKYRNYGMLRYFYFTKRITDYGGTYEDGYSITGDWEDVHLCKECSEVFNTLLGLYGFEKLKNRSSLYDTTINIKK